MTHSDHQFLTTVYMRDDGNIVLDKSAVKENIPTNTTNIEKLD